MPRAVVGVVGIIFAVTAAPVLITALASHRFLYHPTSLSRARLAALGSGGGWRVDKVAVEPGVFVLGLVRPPTVDGAPWFLMFGGNASSLEQNQAALSLIPTSSARDVGLAVYAYRGYDGSSGAPSQAAIARDAERLVEHLAKEHAVSISNLTLVGQSLGSGVAAHVAAELSRANTPPRAVVLVSAYSSIAQVFEDHVPLVPLGWAVRDRWATDAIIGRIEAPIVLVHGDRDAIIGLEHARRLEALAAERAKLVVLPGRAHDDVWADAALVTALRSAGSAELDAAR